ncbi:hypothetical protein S245_063778, partial [Arachis hypogaea]
MRTSIALRLGSHSRPWTRATLLSWRSYCGPKGSSTTVRPNISMGMNLNMAKMLRCAGNNDIITVKGDDGSDTVTFIFECPTQDKISDFEMKLMDIDSEHLGIPEAEYHAIVRMPSTEFARICSIGDTVVISVTKEGVKFSTKDDIGTANIVCRHNSSVNK